LAAPGSTAPDLTERLLAGEKRALARAITLVENDDPTGWALVREVYPRTGRAAVVGFTGPPGVGKSTLIGALTAHARQAEREVAVLSIDPSSPFTKGPSWGTASGSRTTFSTVACSSARWPPGDRLGGSRRLRSRPPS